MKNILHFLIPISSYISIIYSEASHLRQKIEQFVHTVGTIEKLTTSENVTRRTTTEGINLMKSLAECKFEVRKNLSDDFDTPGAFEAVFALLSKVSKYNSLVLNSIENRTFSYALEPVQSVKMYILDFFALLGVPKSVFIETRTFKSSSFTNANVDEKFNLAVDAFVNFRSKVREAGIEGVKTASFLEKKLSKGKAIESDDVLKTLTSTKQIMSLCDW